MSRGTVVKPPADFPDADQHRIMIAEYVRQEAPTYLNAAPTSGRHVVGDIVYNDAPGVGLYIGWVCTVSGEFDQTPAADPVFNQFGAIV
jgi:hypothetical protein